MSDERFERLKKIAKEEFGVEIVRRNCLDDSALNNREGVLRATARSNGTVEKKEGFKEVFGFDVGEVKEE